MVKTPKGSLSTGAWILLQCPCTGVSGLCFLTKSSWHCKTPSVFFSSPVRCLSGLPLNVPPLMGSPCGVHAMSQSPRLLTALELESFRPSLSYHLPLCTAHRPLKVLLHILGASSESSMSCLDHTSPHVDGVCPLPSSLQGLILPLPLSL